MQLRALFCLFLFAFSQLNKVTVAYELYVVLVKGFVDIGVFHNQVFPITSFPPCGYGFHFVGRKGRVYVGFANSVGDIRQIFDKILFKFVVRFAAFDAFGEDEVIGHRNMGYLAEKSRKAAGKVEYPHRRTLGALRCERL